MSYTINNTRAQTIATITPGTVTNIGGLTLIGKNYTGYGELIDGRTSQVLMQSHPPFRRRESGCGFVHRTNTHAPHTLCT